MTTDSIGLLRKSTQFKHGIYAQALKVHFVLSGEPADYGEDKLPVDMLSYSSRRWSQDVHCVQPQDLKALIEFADAKKLLVHDGYRQMLARHLGDASAPDSGPDSSQSPFSTGLVPPELDFRA